MKSNTLLEMFKNGNMVIPMYILKKVKKFNLNMDEFVFLMYLYNLGDKHLFDPNKFSEELDYSMMEVLNYIDKLTEKGLVRVEVIKNDKDIMEEVVVLEGFFNKLSLLMMEEINKVDIEKQAGDIFSVLESEFGRSLTPMELEISKAWLNNGYSQEIIIEAIKEAVFNHVTNLKYIDKILYDWSKNNIKTVKDVDDNRKKRSAKKEEDVNIDLDIVDWNWFDEED